MDKKLRELYAAIDAMDADQVERVLNECFRSGFTCEYVPALVQLLGTAWHFRHEDVVSALQRLKDPRAVDGLYQEALVSYEYLNYDEFFGFARKCTWALADIGTPEAKAKLQLLAQVNNIMVAGYAQRRLDHWEEEKPRKGSG